VPAPDGAVHWNLRLDVATLDGRAIFGVSEDRFVNLPFDRHQLAVHAEEHIAIAAGQFFSSCLIRLSNSSNEIAPLILWPLMKKVGVALTFSTSSANFSSADSLSKRA
jgi:hypothetical protein